MIWYDTVWSWKRCMCIDIEPSDRSSSYLTLTHRVPSRKGAAFLFAEWNTWKIRLEVGTWGQCTSANELSTVREDPDGVWRSSQLSRLHYGSTLRSTNFFSWFIGRNLGFYLLHAGTEISFKALLCNSPKAFCEKMIWKILRILDLQLNC